MSDEVGSIDGLFDVSGKNALVTGGGRRIGLMIARGLVQAGVRVVIASRKAGDLEAAAAELRAFGECEAIPADLSTPDGARALAKEVRARLPTLHILVNNSGATWGRRSRSSQTPGGIGSSTPTSRASST